MTAGKVLPYLDSPLKKSRSLKITKKKGKKRPAFFTTPHVKKGIKHQDVGGEKKKKKKKRETRRSTFHFSGLFPAKNEPTLPILLEGRKKKGKGRDISN